MQERLNTLSDSTNVTPFGDQSATFTPDITSNDGNMSKKGQIYKEMALNMRELIRKHSKNKTAKKTMSLRRQSTLAS